MATKIFCDCCGQEIKNQKVVKVWNAPSESDSGFYEFCYSCWKKNWKFQKKQK